MLIMMGSVKGSPGVTTLAVALAARWPAGDAVVIEADPAGGDLAMRYRTHRSPGLTELAADGRAGHLDCDIGAYAHRLPVGADVVFGPAADQMTQPVMLLAGNDVKVLRTAANQRTLLVDVGRLDAASPALAWLPAADLLLIVTAGGLDALDAVTARRAWWHDMPGLSAPVRLVVIGSSPHPIGDIQAATGLQVAGVLPYDRRGADLCGGRARPGRGWSRLGLLRAARALGLTLTTGATDDTLGIASAAMHDGPNAARHHAAMTAEMGES